MESCSYIQESARQVSLLSLWRQNSKTGCQGQLICLSLERRVCASQLTCCRATTLAPYLREGHNHLCSSQDRAAICKFVGDVTLCTCCAQTPTFAPVVLEQAFLETDPADRQLPESYTLRYRAFAIKDIDSALSRYEELRGSLGAPK